MDLVKLGRSGLQVSPLCLGTMTFGEADESSFMHQVGCDAKTSKAIMSRALDAGLQFFDTADIYGQDGLSERIVGDWFKDTGARDRVVLATKFRFTTASGSGASRRHIIRACEESLRRLRTDWIDLYQIHMQDIEVPEEETLRALDDLVHQGKVRYIGASNYAAYRLVDSLWISKAQGLSRWVSLQMQYSLVERNLEKEHIPAALRWGLGVIPWSPLASGFLTGKVRQGQAPADASRLAKWHGAFQGMDNPRHWGILAAVDKVAEETGATPAQVSLAWLLHKPGVSSVIFGCRSVAQLEENLPAAELVLSSAQLDTLDQASAQPLPYPYDFLFRVQGRW
ncbi:MAG: aldo/keto reductase [Oligoflexia bacterium]|nr:aldo/keto reductase [Oligoflexia bacterium]